MSMVITGLSSMATRLILADLSEAYEARSGVKVDIRSMGGVEAARLVREGEATDIVILASKAMQQLEAEGRIVAGSIKPFTRSGMAIAIREGSARPDIRSGEAVRRAIAQAGKIGYSTGPSGDHLLKLCEGWGLIPELGDRLVKAPPGVPVASLVATGETDLGFQQLSELVNVPGVEVLGPLPDDIQSVTIFAAGIAAASQRPAETQALIDFLTSPQTAPVKQKHGMEPA